MLAMLFAYRKKCASDSPAGQLILPEALRVLPLFTLCTHKMLALRPNSKVRCVWPSSLPRRVASRKYYRLCEHEELENDRVLVSACCTTHGCRHVSPLPPLPCVLFNTHLLTYLPLQGGAPDVRADERAARLLANHSLSVEGMVKVLYPSLYSVHDLPPDIGDAPPPRPPPPAAASEPGAVGAGVGLEGVRGVEGIWGSPRPGVDVPVALPPTSEKLSSSGVFLLDNGEELLLYVGRSVSREVMSELFGVDAVPGESSQSRQSASPTSRKDAMPV